MSYRTSETISEKSNDISFWKPRSSSQISSSS